MLTSCLISLLLATGAPALIAAGHENEVVHLIGEAISRGHAPNVFGDVQIESSSIAVQVPSEKGRLLLRPLSDASDAFATTKSFALLWRGSAAAPASALSFAKGLALVDDGTFWQHVAPQLSGASPTAAIVSTSSGNGPAETAPLWLTAGIAWLEIVAWFVLLASLAMRGIAHPPRARDAWAFAGLVLLALIPRALPSTVLLSGSLDALAPVAVEGLDRLPRVPVSGTSLLWIAQALTGRFPSDWGARLFELLDAVGCALAGLAVRQTAGARAGVLTGLILAFWPLCVSHGRIVGPTGPVMFLTALLLVETQWIAMACVAVLLLFSCPQGAALVACAALARPEVRSTRGRLLVAGGFFLAAILMTRDGLSQATEGGLTLLMPGAPATVLIAVLAVIGARRSSWVPLIGVVLASILLWRDNPLIAAPGARGLASGLAVLLAMLAGRELAGWSRLPATLVGGALAMLCLVGLRSPPLRTAPRALLPELTALGSQSSWALHHCRSLYLRANRPDGLSADEALLAVRVGLARAPSRETDDAAGACILATLGEPLSVTTPERAACEQLSHEPGTASLHAVGCDNQ